MSLRQVADKALVAKSFSKMEQAVLKATRCNLKPPKEKHVRNLLVYTSEQSHRNSEMLNLLAKRLELPEWIVVMKALIVLHRLMRDAPNQQFIQDLRYRIQIFSLRKFADMSSPEAHHQSIFIRKYSQYLEEKVAVFKNCGIEFEKDPNAMKNFTVEELFDRLPRLQSQLNALINNRACKDHLNNPVIITAWNYLLKDSFKLYRALNDGIIILLEHYFTMARNNAVKALDIYKLFTRETDGLIQIIEISRRFAKSDLPDLQHAPTTLVEALENHIKELESGKTPTANSQATKNLVKDTKNKTSFSTFDERDLLDFGSSSSAFDEQGNAKNSTGPVTSFQEEKQSSDFLPTFGGDVFGSSSNTAFDPFGLHNNVQQQPPQQSYDSKLKQIQMVMAQAPIKPAQVAPTGFGVAPTQGFGNQFDFASFSSQPPQQQNFAFSPAPQVNTAPPQPAQSSNPFSSSNPFASSSSESQNRPTNVNTNPFL